MRTRGFTLIELMVVLVMIGIITAVMLPEMRGTFGHEVLRGAARKVVNACNLAHSRAVTRNEVCRLRLEPAGNRYAIEVKSAGTFRTLPDAVSAGALDSRVAVQLRTPSEDREAGDERAPERSPNTVSFYPDGTADEAEITLRDREGFQLNLRVHATTARVEIVEAHPEAER